MKTINWSVDNKQSQIQKVVTVVDRGVCVGGGGGGGGVLRNKFMEDLEEWIMNCFCWDIP